MLILIRLVIRQIQIVQILIIQETEKIIKEFITTPVSVFFELNKTVVANEKDIVIKVDRGYIRDLAYGKIVRK